MRETATRFGLAVNTQARVSELSVGERQRVEILKALYRGARVLILDEPTAVLTPQESRDLFATLRQLVTEGLSIIFISHKLDEVLAVSDRIAVLQQRPARRVARRARGDQGRARGIDGGPGRRDADAQAPCGGSVRHRRARRARARCAWRQCSSMASISTVAAGEIVAIAGVAGNGQQALAGSAVGNACAGTRDGDARRPRARRERRAHGSPRGPREFRRIGMRSA